MSGSSTLHPNLPANAAGMPDCACRCWLREPDVRDIDDIHAWLRQPAMHQWFDFGLGRQELPAPALQVMLRNGRHHLRVFGAPGHDVASGLVAVSDIAHAFASASFWVLREPSRPVCAGMTPDATHAILHEAFERYRLRCITAWAVQTNTRSQALLARVGFRRIGIQRACHVINGQSLARVLYDLTPAGLTRDAGRP